MVKCAYPRLLRYSRLPHPRNSQCSLPTKAYSITKLLGVVADAAERVRNSSSRMHSKQEFLGQGSFGFVTIVRKKEGIMEGTLFALKSLSKLGVVEGGQVQHVKDEKAVSRLRS